MLCLFIDDGQTFEGNIPGLPGEMPALTFTYRKATGRKVYEYIRASYKTADDEIAAAAKLVAAHLVSWNAARKDPASGLPVPVPVSVESLVQLADAPGTHRYFVALVNHVQGHAASSADAAPDPNV